MGNIVMDQNVGVHGMISLGTKHIAIGLFKFSSKDKKPQNYQSWVKAISKYQRRGGGDTFDPFSKNTVICEHNFKEENLKKAAGSTRKRIRKVPSLQFSNLNI